MIQKKLFDPTAALLVTTRERKTLDYRRYDAVYVYDKQTVHAVNTALATGRPLLVRGPSGSGTSSLAPSVAQIQGWRYYEYVITSHTQTQDLLWQFDYLRHRDDAHASQLRNAIAAYIRPGVLWWAFDSASALRHCFRSHESEKSAAADPNLGDEGPGTVVLLDEVDKGEPDLPNNLLPILGSLQFLVEDTGEVVRADLAPLVVITTNEERALPDAFLRRCVELKLDRPDKDRLVRIGTLHFPRLSEATLRDIADRVFQAASDPSPAEYLDVVRAWCNLGGDSQIWQLHLDALLRTQGRTDTRPEGAMSGSSFDVFLSHNSKDKPDVRELAEALRARGLRVWLDEWELIPGRPWQEALEEVVETAGSSAVLVGKDGLGPWQDKEMRGCLSEFVDRNLPVIPVLLPSASEVPRLPIFLKGFTWVDLRGGLTEEGIDRLQWGITGKRPTRR